MTFNIYGGYEITSSVITTLQYNRPKQAFLLKNSSGSGSWHSLSGKYNVNSGNYTGSASSTNGYNGEWIQINFGKKQKYHYYQIRPQGEVGNGLWNAPKELYFIR